MNPIQKRFLLFLIGCIGSRTLFAILAKNISVNYLPVLGYIALLPAIGFIYIYVSGSRKTGVEVGGEKIWWNDLRPIHALLYLLFAYNAIYKNADSWKYLAVDVVIGLVSFLIHHVYVGSFSKLF
jgi:hypothetical protein